MGSLYDSEGYKLAVAPGTVPVQTTISPITGKPILTRDIPQTLAELDSKVVASLQAFNSWKLVPLDTKLQIISKAVDSIVNDAPALAKEITEQMGRPIRYSKGEIAGFEERARWLIKNAKDALKDQSVDEGRPEGIKRVIRRVPLGVSVLVGAWNFPYLITVNALIPALLAGNSVILKPSPQTPLTGERIQEHLTAAGLPKDVLQVLHLTPPQMDYLVSHPLVPFISFTGSVQNGKNVELAAAAAAKDSGAFKVVGLELGGKDAAYVRQDSDPTYAAENVIDGAFFNSGQSCCAVERVYVHESIYDKFVDECVRVVKDYKLGDPREEATTLGPVVSQRSAEAIRAHISEAVSQGAKALIPESLFPEAKVGTPYVAPQVLVDVNHSMKVMMDETFGPVVGIMKVKSDEEALELINDSPYGLTASVWTKDLDAFNSLVDGIDTGTVFLNRCDYLDPALPWTGVKESGRGISLSKHGFEAVTRAKSIHVRAL
ncbi:succinate semialdehyde dehydrogenase [Meredithblackwellia eburnea MCA 4105]